VERTRPSLWKQCWTGNAFLLSRLSAAKHPEGPPFYFAQGLSDDHLLSPDAAWLTSRKQTRSNGGRSIISLPKIFGTRNALSEKRIYRGQGIVVPPKNYAEIIDAGYERDKHFRVVIGNYGQVRTCLLVAPHGGSIEPMTSEIVFAVASVSNRAYYLFEGQLRRNNWKDLHIDSTSFDEPDFEMLVANTELVVSFPWGRARSRTEYLRWRSTRGRARAHSKSPEWGTRPIWYFGGRRN
jgi:hypothetical protein